MSSGRHSRSTLQLDGLSAAAALLLSRPLALSWSMACAGTDRTASAASTEENGALRQSPSDEAGERRDDDVAGMVEGGIAPDASRQLLPCDKAEREGSNCRAEDVTDHSDEAVGNQNRPEGRPERDDGCAGREHGK